MRVKMVTVMRWYAQDEAQWRTKAGSGPEALLILRPLRLSDILQLHSLSHRQCQKVIEFCDKLLLLHVDIYSMNIMCMNRRQLSRAGACLRGPCTWVPFQLTIICVFYDDIFGRFTNYFLPERQNFFSFVNKKSFSFWGTSSPFSATPTGHHIFAHS